MWSPRTQRVTCSIVGRVNCSGAGANSVLSASSGGDMDMSLCRADGQLLSLDVSRTFCAPRAPSGLGVNALDGERPECAVRTGHPPSPWSGAIREVVLNHGSTGVGDQPEWFRRTWTNPELSAFLVSRGWQVIYSRRRGRRQSDVRIRPAITAPSSCESHLYR